MQHLHWREILLEKSLREEENDGQQKAKSDSGRRNDNCKGHEADSPGTPAKRARTDNASLLEA